MAEIPNDIPGNSRKQQSAVNAQAAGKATDGKPEIPVFEGPTAGIKRKGSGAFWRWAKRMFLSDRKPKDILMEVVEQRIVPGIKDNMRNSAMATIDSFIYQGASAAPVSMQNNISYNKIYSGQQTRGVTPQPQQDPKAEELNKGFANPCFQTQNDAVTFLNLMKSYDYPTLSVHTMYMMQKKHIDYTWDAYGWNKEEIAALGPNCIRTTGNSQWPWMIVLPPAHPVN